MELINEKDYKKIMAERVEPFLEKIRTNGFFESFDGKKIHFEAYKNENAKAVVLIIHGFTESAEKFREVSYYFYNEGYSVYAIDLRDHGKSFRTSQRPGTVETDDFHKYAEDISCLVEKEIKAQNEGKKIFIYSHSLGSTAALLYMLKNPTAVKKAVLSSPMICGNMGMPVIIAGTVAKVLSAIGGKKISAPGRCKFDPELSFQNSDATSSERFSYYHEKRKADSLLQTNGPSFGWVKASIEARDKILSCADEINAELLVIKPQEDKQLLMEYTDKFIQKSKAKTKEIKNSKHEIFMSENETLSTYFEEIFSFLQ